MGNATASDRNPEFQDELTAVYDAMEGSQESEAYSERHNINSAAILTVIDDETADAIAEHLAPRIRGKTVVEIGGGIGLLGLHLGYIAKRVYCIEANPMWSWTFAKVLLKHKQKNLSYLFGSADEFVGMIKADVAIFCSHSDIQGLKLVGQQFAPTVIDVYGELMAANPGSFDPVASELRKFA